MKKNSAWKARDEVISMQRWLSTVLPTDDGEIVGLRNALANARRHLETIAIRMDEDG